MEMKCLEVAKSFRVKNCGHFLAADKFDRDLAALLLTAYRDGEESYGKLVKHFGL